MIELWPDLDVEDRRQESAGVVRNVTRPTLTRFGDGSGPAVVVAPGGGMHLLSTDTEGRGPCQLLVDAGLTAYLLEYRLLETPVTDEDFGALFVGLASDLTVTGPLARAVDGHRPVAAEDGRRALELVRKDHEKVGFLGFSAGGILGCDLLAAQEQLDAAALVYVPFMTPATASPTALWVLAAQDDPFGTVGSVELYTTWTGAGQPCELHLYPEGGHGFGTQTTGRAVDEWPSLLVSWLGTRGFC